MEEIEAELRGRLVMLETLLGATIAHLAERAAAPERAIAAIMANAEDLLHLAQANASESEQRAATYALAAFDQLSSAMLEHVAKIADPAGTA